MTFTDVFLLFYCLPSLVSIAFFCKIFDKKDGWVEYGVFCFLSLIPFYNIIVFVLVSVFYIIGNDSKILVKILKTLRKDL